MDNFKRLLTPTETAEFLSVSRQRVYELTRRGDLPVVILGSRQYRYDARELDRLVNRKTEIGEASTAR